MSDPGLGALSGAPFIFGPAGANPTGKTNEDQELAQGPQGPPPRQPHGSPQGPHLYHQQDGSALQGASGLRRAAPSVVISNFASVRYRALSELRNRDTGDQ